jgi:pimeloyl-ACP methyl ester carboxylesterase
MNTQYLENENGKIAYEEDGNGPLVICMPSMGDLRTEYRLLTPQLVNAGYRSVCMDVRGHGESSITWKDYSVVGIGSDLVALIQKLNGGPVYIVATSMSAGAAVWAAAEIPELVKGMVLIGPFVRGEINWLSRLFYAILFHRPWGVAMWNLYYNSLYPTRKPADFASYRAALRENLQQPGRIEALQQMLRASKSASEQRLSRIVSPTLVLMGSKDPDFKKPETEAAWVAGQLKAHYEMIKNAGHYPHAEMPEVSGPLILSFLNSLKVAGK